MTPEQLAGIRGRLDSIEWAYVRTNLEPDADALACVSDDVRDLLAVIDQLPALLIELQAASWSRSWSRVLKAREQVRLLTGIEVTGPLKASLRER
jgi:hypothetical protein